VIAGPGGSRRGVQHIDTPGTWTATRPGCTVGFRADRRHDRRLVDVEQPRERGRTVSNRILTDIRAPRLLDGRDPSWYLAQHALPEQQEQSVLELDTLS
jgi:hypothetical protein